MTSDDQTGQAAATDEIQHHWSCDYARHPDDPDAECHCLTPADRARLECGHIVEDYCYCSEY
ncbi:MAG: hypothetical protein IRZ07_28260 [Microbispora sp.]|nr:hypothetical protein [Microbispora sp.]